MYCTPPSSKWQCSMMIMIPTSSILSPLQQSSTISAKFDTVKLVTRGDDTNQAIRDVLYGDTESSIEVCSTPSSL
jgi:hypothetical protein